MKPVTDLETGELLEVLDTELVGLQPYSFREAKAAHMRASVERRKIVERLKMAVREQGTAEAVYRRELARGILTEKQDLGATVAEAVAKGREEVMDARQRLVIAEGMVRATQEELKGADGDRTGIAQLVKWSEAVSTGPWGDGG